MGGIEHAPRGPRATRARRAPLGRGVRARLSRRASPPSPRTRRVFAGRAWAPGSGAGSGAAARPRAAPATPRRPRPAPKTEQLETVNITGSRPDDVQERRQSTAAKIIVGRDEIDRFGDSTLGDVLKRLPGVTIQGRPGRGGAIRMRGLGNGYTQILLDGERVPPGFSLDSISPDQVERIEILRAPTAETGAGRSPARSTSSPARATTGASTTCA
jgi:iron complex outermembrane receptor protein